MVNDFISHQVTFLCYGSGVAVLIPSWIGGSIACPDVFEVIASPVQQACVEALAVCPGETLINIDMLLWMSFVVFL